MEPAGGRCGGRKHGGAGRRRFAGCALPRLLEETGSAGRLLARPIRPLTRLRRTGIEADAAYEAFGADGDEPSKILMESPRIPPKFLKQAPWPASQNHPTDIGVRREASMKHLINATTLALGLFCAGGVSAAQDQTQPTNLRNVTVTAIPGQYETYVANLHTGYTLHALVGNTHKQYMQARRAADQAEAVRKSGAPVTHVAVAIDNSAAPGVARQIQVFDPARNTVAIVNVYCKRTMPSGAARCALAPRLMQAGNEGQRVASTQAGSLQVAEVNLRSR